MARGWRYFGDCLKTPCLFIRDIFRGYSCSCVTHPNRYLLLPQFLLNTKQLTPCYYLPSLYGEVDKNESCSALNSRAPFGYPDWGFPWFSSVVRQMPGYSMQSGGRARTPLPHARRLHLSAWHSLRQSQSGLENQTANQLKFIPPILSPWQTRP